MRSQKLRPRLLAAASVFLLIAQFPLQAGAEAIVAKEEVANFLLGNGMEVVVIPDHRAPIVTHMVWYKAGSADEPPGKSGIAHFFEHLMFKGTKTHKPGEFDAKVSEIGGNENAFTSYDYTAYHETISPDALGDMMAMEADRMRNLILTDEVIGPERDVVLEERRMRIEGDPDSLLSEEVQATLYQNHPYRVPVIGWMHEMEKLNRADATEFYDRFYTPNNAVLVVAGDVDVAAVRKMAEDTYGKVARGPDLPPRTRPTEPEQNTSRTVTMKDARVTLPSFGTQWVVPSYRTAENGEAEALDLLAEILGGGTRSRLYQALVVNDDAASGVGAYYNGTMLDDTSFTVYGAPRDKAALARLEADVAAQIQRIQRDGVTESELEKAKNRLIRSMVFAKDSPASMANIYGAALTTGSTVEDVQKWPERLQAITADQVKAVAVRYLRPRIAVTGYLLPDDSTSN
ncbi:MAG: insulinase family protein [Rhizobiaceae bacterium]|nr:insulinase family protein [Rhizobiaceae bacterium]